MEMELVQYMDDTAVARGVVRVLYPKNSSHYTLVYSKKMIPNQGDKPMKRLNKAIVWAIALFFHSQLLVQVFAAEPERIALAELKRLLDAKEDVILIDVRNQAAYNFGHIPRAISMPFPDGIMKRDIKNFPPMG